MYIYIYIHSVLFNDLFHGDMAPFASQSAHRHANLSGSSHKHLEDLEEHTLTVAYSMQAADQQKVCSKRRFPKWNPQSEKWPWTILERPTLKCKIEASTPFVNQRLQHVFPFLVNRMKAATEGFSPTLQPSGPNETRQDWSCFVNLEDTWAVTQNPSQLLIL